jgi:hypothetical protein
MMFRIFDLFITNKKTRAKYHILVTIEGLSKKGCMAISWVTEAVLGEGKDMEIAYMIKQ